MSNYLGCECIVCGQKFNKNDDIVVCPDCGTPYHRDCYMESGKCANEELHESGESWKGAAAAEKDKSEYKKCPYCETVNKPHTIICENCGAPLVDNLNKNMSSENNHGTGGTNNTAGNAGMFGNTFAFDPNDKYCGMDPEEEFETAKLSELADFVKTNQLFYLPIFKKIKETGQKISLNLISFLVPSLYFANRKMWLLGVISIILSTAFSLPYMIYMFVSADIIGGFLGSINVESKSFEIISEVARYLNFAFKTVVLLFSNWLYYRHSLNKIKQKKLAQESGDAEKFSNIGGTSTAATCICFLAQIALTSLIMFFLMK